jgi:hypothetical protein
MNSRTYPTTCAVREMVSLVWITNVDILRSAKFVIEISLGFECVWLREEFGVSVYSPNRVQRKVFSYLTRTR